MKPKDQILTHLKQQLPYLRSNFKVKSIGLFGSYARDEQTETSDIDMLVEFEAPVTDTPPPLRQPSRAGQCKYIMAEIIVAYTSKNFNT